MITIDGYEWPVPCDLKRTAEIRPSEISGMMLDKSYFNDVIGTFLQYDVTLAVPPDLMDDYDALYETLTDPVDGHVFEFPYGQSTITVTARVENVNDVLVYTTTRRQYWKGIQFSAISNHPTKTMSLDEVIAVGRAGLPEEGDVPEGTIYRYSPSGWVEVEIVDADEVYY